MFVCLGNICRSPAAQSVFEHKLKAAGLSEEWIVDSTGTDAYHVGEQSDHRMRKAASRRGISIHHSSQRFSRSHFREFDYIMAMDKSNYRDLMFKAETEEEKSRIYLFRDFDPEGTGDVPDPWYGGPQVFETVLDLVERTCENIILKGME